MQISPALVLTALVAVLLLVVAGWLTRLSDWRAYLGTETGAGTSGGFETWQPNREKPGGLSRWLTTVDHKDIGLLYAIYAVVAFAWGGGGALLLRLELISPALDLFPTATLYNAVMTTHGITMLFLFGSPMIFAIGNYVVPLLIDADDMAFPRINAIAFWILPFATVLIWGGFFTKPFLSEVGPAAISWTMYTPLSTQAANPGVDIFLLGMHLSGIATTMGAVNFIATIVAERGPSVTWANLDIFSWTMLTSSGIILFVFPLLGAVFIMLLLDRNFGTVFFAPEGGGALLFQHLFWFFGHPEVYILVLPPMGILSLVLPKFAGRKLFGFRFIVYSTLAIGVLANGVWAHHMFTTGMDPRLRASFMAVSLAIAIPSAVKVFNWITTMWNGKLRMTAPMLFCIGSVQNFILGGVTGVFLAAIPFDLVMQDTYYVVGHFHLITFGMIGFALFAAAYYWFPLVTGRMYHKGLARWHFGLSLVGSNVTFIAMIVSGYGGMPRRYATYLPRFADWQQVATFGTLLMTAATAIWLWNVVQSVRAGPRVTDGDPWNLKEVGQFTNEWQWFERQNDSPATDAGEPSGTDVGTPDTAGGD